NFGFFSRLCASSSRSWLSVRFFSRAVLGPLNRTDCARREHSLSRHWLARCRSFVRLLSRSLGDDRLGSFFDRCRLFLRFRFRFFSLGGGHLRFFFDRSSRRNVFGFLSVAGFIRFFLSDFRCFCDLGRRRRRAVLRFFNWFGFLYTLRFGNDRSFIPVPFPVTINKICVIRLAVIDREHWTFEFTAHHLAVVTADLGFLFAGNFCSV